MSAHLGEDYKPLKPSDTIKELSDMCFGHDYADVVSPTVLAQKDGNGVYHIVSHDVTDHAAEPTLEQLLEGFEREPVPERVDHAAELAEALDHLSILYVPNGPYGETQRRKAFAALTKYRQSRGE